MASCCAPPAPGESRRHGRGQHRCARQGARAAPRVMALGKTVVFDEEITTDGSGLVQILLLDGTTFTVGPNSQLTIDEFVYNPGRATQGRRYADQGRLPLRRRAHQPASGGAVVKTPVGTIGIRGAMDEGLLRPRPDGAASLISAAKSASSDPAAYPQDLQAGLYADRLDGGRRHCEIRYAAADESRCFQFQRRCGQPPGNSGGATTTRRQHRDAKRDQSRTIPSCRRAWWSRATRSRCNPRHPTRSRRMSPN